MRRSIRVSVGQGLAGAALVAMGLAAGAWAGMDAAAQVDARYRNEPEVRVSVPVPAPVSRWEPVPTPEPAAIAAPPAGSVWGQEIGRDERAFFDPAIGEEPPAVGVHRGLRRSQPRLEPDVAATVEPDPADLSAEITSLKQLPDARNQASSGGRD